MAREETAGFERGTFRLLDERLREAHTRTSIPGGVLSVYREGTPVYLRAFGTAQGVNALYDTGSLTKPLAGPVAAMALEDRGEWTEQSAWILAHRTGWDDEEHFEPLLEAAVYFDRRDTQEAGERRLRTLEPPDQDVYTYSNTAYAVLSLAFAHSLDRPAEVLEERLQGIAGSEAIAFHPGAQSRVVPSGRTRAGAVLRGRPYDPLADLMVSRFGIPPLHSGLFASADAVAGHFAGVLDPGDDGERAHLREMLFGGVTERRDSGSGRRLYVSEGGLVSPTGRPWAPEGARPGRFFVQTGYTGCLLWVDTERSLVAVLLTNASLTGAHEEWRSLAAEIVRVIHAGAQ